MSSACLSSLELYFWSVNGSKIKLIDKSLKAKNVMKFVLYKNVHLNANATLLLLVGTFFLWNAFDIFVPLVISILILTLQFVSFITSVNKDTLTVVEFVGIYTEAKGTFYGLTSCEFIPWDTVEDIFINEVITGVSIIIIFHEFSDVPLNSVQLSAKSIILSDSDSKRIVRRKRFNKISSVIQGPRTRKKMPGIYVRKTNWIDWTEREDNPNLIIPGSYWLCHKNNIYKFIFRYHRTNRSITQFYFGKELMKVIRRIIKNPPPQGQQFSTSHLLITFNLTWWNKQDKVFALLKFNERSVNTYSHAFILTIKLNDPASPEQTLKPSSPDRSSNYQNLNEASVCTDEDPNKLCNNLNVSFEIFANSEDNASLNDKINDYDSLLGGTNCLEDANIERESSPTSNRTTNNENESNQQDAEKDFDEQFKPINNDAPVDDNNADSANLPYQYLIEKEIEASEQNVRKRKLGEENETDINLESQADSQLQDLPYSRKKKYELDNFQRSSSDITNLVMEGLMFTIRQGQDAVAVIEQKTKLEMDEVLENSEKVETEEGEKRLRNSSLLGLENLITMIESPSGNKFESKYVVAQEYTLQNQLLDNKINEHGVTANLNHTQPKTPDDTVLIGANSDYTERQNQKCIKLLGEDKGECKEKDKEQHTKEQREIREEETETLANEDEDIIPEALQNDIRASMSQDEFMNREYLLTDDIYKPMDICVEHVNTRNSRSNRRSKINAPIILSNKLISVNEIPSSLREILKDRLPMEPVPSDNRNEINEANNIEKQEKQPCEEEEKTSTIQSETDISKAPFIEEASVNNSEGTCESKPSATLEVVSNVVQENVQLKEEPEETNKIECSYLYKLKNITEDFHKNIEHLQKRPKTRRKSSYLQNANGVCDVHVQMSKLFEDITRGAKVIVKRIDLNKCS